MAIVFSNASFSNAKTLVPDADITDAMFDTARTIAEAYYNQALTSVNGVDPYTADYRNIIGSNLIAHFATVFKSNITEVRVLDLAVKYARNVSAVGLDRSEYGKTVKELDYNGLLQNTTNTVAGFL